MTYPCPACRAPADDVSGCSRCGRGPDPDAAEVIRLDLEIPVLTERAATARRAWQSADRAVTDAWRRRTEAVARIQSRLAPAAPAPAPLPVPAAVAAVTAAPRPEASTRTVQNVLFLLGGLLLGVAAVVFTAVAWNTFGVGGRALLLAAFTALALGAPLLALRRGLTATAETIAAVGLLLVLLDGYAAWYVNLFGVAGGSAARYAAGVFAVTALTAAGYARLTGLTGPRFAALAAVQPVLPLAVAAAGAGPVGWAWTLTGVAALNLGVVVLTRRPVRWAAWGLGAAWLAAAGLLALAASAFASRTGTAVTAGLALVGAAALALAGALVSRRTPAVAAAAGLVVAATGVAAARPLLLLDVTGTPALVAAVAAALAAAVAAGGRLLPAGVRVGPRAGAFLVLGLPGLGALAGTLAAVAATVEASRPAWAAGWSARPGNADSWPLPVTVLLLLAGLLVLLPRPARRDTALAGAALLSLGLTAGLHLPWWVAPALLLAAASTALLLAARATAPATATRRAAVAAAPLLVALLVGAGRPAVLAAVLATLLATGLTALALAHRRPGAVVAAVTAGAGLLVLPATAASAAAAAGAPDHWVARAALAALAALVALAWTTRAATSRAATAPRLSAPRLSAPRLSAPRLAALRLPALAAAAGAAVIAPAWALPAGDPSVLYAAAAVLAVAVTVRAAGPGRAALAAAAGALPGLWLVVAALPGLAAVLVAPYEQLGRVWDGPVTLPAPAGAVAGALGVAALAVAVLIGRNRAVLLSAVPPVAGAAALVAVGAAGAPWPVRVAAAVAAGLGGLLGTAVRRRTGADVAACGAVSAGFAGAGLAGAFAARPATLVALGATAAVAAACGAAGRTGSARVAGWLGAVGAAGGFALAAGRAAGLTPAGAAFGVLAVAALALALGAALRSRRPGESAAVQASAHVTAVLALLLCAGSANAAAAVCVLWGVVLGLRALWPGEAANPRRVLVVAAAGAELLGWWIVAGSGGVTTPEAYTLPAAAVGLLAGWLALRAYPRLSSWTAWGPALAAALLPSLAAVFAAPDAPLRRLLLGAGALAVLVLGAATRRQAPVVAGGAVLTLVALHELVRVWDLLPRWIPLAAGGLLLVGLAMTLERRRRDLHRVRSAVARMT
ncbi:SCO7613 C-terminal domain-containing membrane protein [Spirilliplanes yamanashiensis]|uniref:Uncharacterized protein n=1 Tax=Spirilliplanes yamanashiensis TaxID=42233 RepID=A0A8J4DJB0_9ACTN|nr:hypothetical protein Sya03_25160 [Spirilliplanes yamanashiensis]